MAMIIILMTMVVIAIFVKIMTMIVMIMTTIMMTMQSASESSPFTGSGVMMKINDDNLTLKLNSIMVDD